MDCLEIFAARLSRNERSLLLVEAHVVLCGLREEVVVEQPAGLERLLYQAHLRLGGAEPEPVGSEQKLMPNHIMPRFYKRGSHSSHRLSMWDFPLADVKSPIDEEGLGATP